MTRIAAIANALRAANEASRALDFHIRPAPREAERRKYERAWSQIIQLSKINKE